MKTKVGLILSFVFSLIFIGTNLALSEEQAQSEAPATIAQPQNNEPDTQWVWGEVTGVDLQTKTITIKYLDYETDQEKEISVSSDDKTTYENIKSIEDLKPKDTLSIDYAIGPDGRNIAKNISVEKPESDQGVSEGTQPEEQKMAVPADSQSTNALPSAPAAKTEEAQPAGQ